MYFFENALYQDMKKIIVQTREDGHVFGVIHFIRCGIHLQQGALRENPAKGHAGNLGA